MQGYRRKFGPENVVELSKNIIVQHEDFLKQDDPDKKADALRYMAGYVAQYLHLVPQESKFTYKETERVLHNSAMNIADFDPREGSLSFRSLAKYAENLMEQPWRTDFHVIKLTSGFYVHNISAQLQNAHEILIVLGYVNIDDTTLKLVPKPNLASLKAVSRDCYIASQECLILSQIWQHVADQEPDYPLTIGEVFEYRKNHLGDTDTICNKLLYDIRARMHLVKHQNHQQYPHSNNQSVPMIKNSQRFVPVDRLIDFDPEHINNDEPDNIMPQNHSFIPEREVDQTQELVKNVNLYNYNQDDEHLYDPVYGGSGDPPSVPQHHQYQQQQHQRRHSSQAAIHKATNNLPGPYFYNNNNSRKSIPALSQPPPQQFLNYNPINPYQAQQFHNNFNSNATSNNLMTMYKESDGRNSMSPMIPKTVTSFFSNSNGIKSSGSRNNVSKSNSMNSISGIRSGVGGASSSSSSSTSQAQQFVNQPLIKTKVKETDLDEPLPRDNNILYFNQVQAPGAVIINDRSLRTRKSVPAVPLTASAGNFVNQSQVFPDEFYPPGIVKPVAVYGSSANNSQFYMRPRLNSDQSEDVLHDAHAYASAVSQISRANNTGPGESKGQNYQHQATPIPMPGSDSDSHSLSSENKSRGGSVRREMVGERSSSEVSSSREGSVLQYGRQNEHQRLTSRKSESAKRPTHIDIRPSASGSRVHEPEAPNIRYADSSPETDLIHAQQQQAKNKNGYRELSSSSSGGSPGSASARNYPKNEGLDSLDTVYYDFLLKKGHTDEVMGNNSVDSRNTQSQHESKRSSSHHHHNPQTHNNYVGSDPDETHMYDGRRVIPKKNHQQEKSISKRLENETRRKKQRNPVESVIPSASKYDTSYNDNLSSAMEATKPSHEKDIKRSTEGERRQPAESEIPSTSYSSSSPLPPPKKEFEPWDCRHCTFQNLKEERICEVCAKSKDFFEEDVPSSQALVIAATSSAQHQQQAQQPYLHSVTPKLFSVPNSNYDNPVAHTAIRSNMAAVVAGPSEPSPPAEEQIECPQCTLLNPRKARICNMCDYRLKKVETPKSLDELYDDIR